ncbi:hypothetical protein WA556_002750, partial [Blastocystis sp. ATCC 50177/Nand II]
MITNDLSRKAIASVCSYESLYRYTRWILREIESRNVSIDCYFYDCLSDVDKSRVYAGRRASLLQTTDKWRQGFQIEDPSGIPQGKGYHLPNIRLCACAIRKAVLDFFEGDKERIRCACVDLDREIAKYASDHDCYVLSSDYDFVVFPIKGLVDLNSCMQSIHRKAHSLELISNLRIYTSFHLSEERMTYLALLQGNDFVNGLPNANIEETIHRIATLDGNLFEDYCRCFPRVEREELRRRFALVMKKYDVHSYPSFPLSCLTDSSHNTAVLEACGVTEESLSQLLASYGTVFSHSLIDCLFSPVLYTPVTLFFQNASYNRYVLGLMLKLYDMVGNGVADACLMETDEGLQYRPSEEAFNQRLALLWPAVRRRLEWARRVATLPLTERVERLRGLDASLIFRQRMSPQAMFREGCFRIARKQLCFLVEKETVNPLMERIRNLVGKREELDGFYPSRDLGCAFECFCSACSIVYTAFQFLHLKTDDALLNRLSLQTLLDLNGA